jgi:hypothetical protein
MERREHRVQGWQLATRRQTDAFIDGLPRKSLKFQSTIRPQKRALQMISVFLDVPHESASCSGI